MKTQDARLIEAALHQMVDRLKYVQAHYPHVITRLKDASGGEGYPSGGSTGPGPTNTDTSTVERAALHHIEHGPHDPVAADVRTLRRLLEQTHTDLFHLEQQVARFVRATPPPPEHRCEKCATPTTTRLKRGLCERCYKAWARAGKPPTIPVTNA